LSTRKSAPVKLSVSKNQKSGFRFTTIAKTRIIPVLADAAVAAKGFVRRKQ